MFAVHTDMFHVNEHNYFYSSTECCEDTQKFSNLNCLILLLLVLILHQIKQ